MLQKINPTRTESWKKLTEHFKVMEKVHMKDLFQNDPARFDRLSFRLGDILVDCSKNRISEETLSLLISLAEEVRLSDAVEQMFEGMAINETEGRAVLHTALRNRKGTPVYVNGRDVMPEVFSILARMRDFSKSISAGSWLGFSGRKITDIVNIGIGGSDLGPFMVTQCLRPYWLEGISAHFVSNVDGTHLTETLKGLSPETTLFMIASKTFTTQETMTNAFSAREWFLSKGASPSDVPRHFVAISTNEKKVREFGISPENMFVFRDWVGGRYSLWSAIGLSIACTIGFENFEELLAGAFEMDEHFRYSPFRRNIPVILAC
ncbi:MAG: glucose-6-phosphate isomerase, partial [Desulfobacteraceae bacterium]